MSINSLQRAAGSMTSTATTSTSASKPATRFKNLGRRRSPRYASSSSSIRPWRCVSAIEQILVKIELPLTREQLRDLRAIRLLEEIATPEAELVLHGLAQGTRGRCKRKKPKQPSSDRSSKLAIDAHGVEPGCRCSRVRQ